MSQWNVSEIKDEEVKGELNKLKNNLNNNDNNKCEKEMMSLQFLHQWFNECLT